jgi:tripartite-type tricarboxylate transporter receptor subunit TctC
LSGLGENGYLRSLIDDLSLHARRDVKGKGRAGECRRGPDGRLKVLAVGTRERDPVIPDIPTFIEEGVNVWTFGAIRGIGAPKDTPGPVIDYLEAAVKKMTEDPEFHQVMKDIVHPVLYRDRKAFLKNMQDGFDMYGKLIKELNLKLE